MHFEVGWTRSKSSGTAQNAPDVHFGTNYAARGRGGEGGGEEKDSERSGRAEGRVVVVGELGNRGNWV